MLFLMRFIRKFKRNYKKSNWKNITQQQEFTYPWPVSMLLRFLWSLSKKLQLLLTPAILRIFKLTYSMLSKFLNTKKPQSTFALKLWPLKLIKNLTALTLIFQWMKVNLYKNKLKNLLQKKFIKSQPSETKWAKYSLMLMLMILWKSTANLWL